MKASSWVLAACILVPTYTMAGEVSVNWIKPEKFKDMDPVSGVKKPFQERVMKSLTDYWQGFADDLPKGYKLQVDITDVDLAGDVRPSLGAGHSDLRIMRDIFFPKMEFSYTLKDATGEMVSKGDEVIKDMNYLFHVDTRSRSHNLKSWHYEKRMIKKWFHTKLKPVIGYQI